MSERSIATQPKASTTISPAQSDLLQRQCACGTHTAGGGKCAECGKKKLSMQRKLMIGATHDPMEHEADRVADQVMRMPEPGLQRQANSERDEAFLQAKPVIQRKSFATQDSETAPPNSVHELLRSPGQPLGTAERHFFEPRFGHDFSQVRVHTNALAGESARAVYARAYTVGGNIAFAEGQYSPSTAEGKRLLAHELTHVVQQGGGESLGFNAESRNRGLSPTTDVQRFPDAIQQGEVGLVDNPEEFEDKESGPTEVAGSTQMMVQRSATWKGATVHETVNPAETPFGGASPITWHLLNGTRLETTAGADGAIKVPGVTTMPLPSTDPAATWMAKVDTVPAQEGSADETVLRPGPWSTVVTKAQAGAVTGLAACSGPGNSTFTRHGRPSDDSVYKANRRHEDRHVADHKDAFDDAIGKWDKKLQDAKTAGTTFTGASAADATAALWTAMGNTPQSAARSYRSQGFAKGAAFHATAGGGPMARSNPVSNADCSTSAMDVTNPMP